MSAGINVRGLSFWWTIKWWPAGAIPANVIAIHNPVNCADCTCLLCLPQAGQAGIEKSEN
jgi:hypothetical protein